MARKDLWWSVGGRLTTYMYSPPTNHFFTVQLVHDYRVLVHMQFMYWLVSNLLISNCLGNHFAISLFFRQQFPE